MQDSGVSIHDTAVKHIKSLLYDARPPALTPDLAGNEDMQNIHAYLTELRQLLNDYSNGDFSRTIKLRGVIAGSLKAFQANILHLIWQVTQVAKGDFSQRVEYMGELSESFNQMVVQLDDALTALKQKEEELTALTQMLEQEVALRGAALKELSVSEARFRYLAEHDPLTGVLNRRSFTALAELEMEQAAAAGEKCCMAILDIDHFKNFNDTYGHIEGDEAIRHTIKICQENLRRDDLIGRYGGEEFIILFTKSSERQGLAVAERIRASIAETPLLVDGENTNLTVSVGLVEITPERFVPHDKRFMPFVLTTADTALYEAKHAGRNLVRAHTLGEY